MQRSMTPRDLWPPFATHPIDQQALIDQKYATINAAINHLLAAAHIERDAGGSTIDLWGILTVHTSLLVESMSPTDVHAGQGYIDAQDAILTCLVAALVLRLTGGAGRAQ